MTSASTDWGVGSATTNRRLRTEATEGADTNHREIPGSPYGGNTTLEFETRIHFQTVFLIRNNHVHWIMQTTEPRQRAWVIEAHRKPEGDWPESHKPTSVDFLLTIHYVTIDGIRHPQKVVDEQGREWPLSDDFRCYITEELRRAYSA